MSADLNSDPGHVEWPIHDAPAGPLVSALDGWIRDERLLRLVAYWDARRGDRLVPSRHDMDPLDFASLLPNMFLLEHEPDSGRVRWRLAGEQINDLLGRTVARAYFDEVFAPEEAMLAQRKIALSLTLPAIRFSAGRLYSGRYTEAQGERVVLPIEEGGVRRLVLGATVYGWIGVPGYPVGLMRPEIEAFVRVR